MKYVSVLAPGAPWPGFLPPEAIVRTPRGRKHRYLDDAQADAVRAHYRESRSMIVTARHFKHSRDLINSICKRIGAYEDKS